MQFCIVLCSMHAVTCFFLKPPRRASGSRAVLLKLKDKSYRAAAQGPRLAGRFLQ